MKLNIKKGKVIKFIIVIILAIIIEVVYFNFTALITLIDNSLEKNLTYKLNDMEKMNWKEETDRLVGSEDPVLIIPNINKKIKYVEISTKSDSSQEKSAVFYSNSDNPTFSEKAMVIANSLANKKSVIKINSMVESLRIDLWDQPGHALDNIEVKINPTTIEFSFARVIAIVAIYIFALLLFSLQKSPDYEI